MSETSLDRAKRLIPTGASTLSKRSRAFVEGSSPTDCAVAHGALFHDTCYRAFLDWSQGLGVNILGGAPRSVTKAVCDALWTGNYATVPSRLEAEAAVKLIDASPYCGTPAMVRWLNSGTEACAAAIRIARRATGRDLVLSSGYHGWLEGFMCLQPFTHGIPHQYREMIAPFQWGDASALLAAMEAERVGPTDVAAVILEPATYDEPPMGYLAELARLTREAGALLIFDETVTGFRYPPGVVTSGVVPDLTIYGKALGAGVQPVAAVVGPAGVMQYGDVISGTYCGGAGAMAAVIAALDFYAAHDVPAHIRHIGLALQRGINTEAETAGLPLRCEGMPARMHLTWPRDAPPDGENHMVSLVIEQLADRNIHVNASAVLPSYAHTADDVMQTVGAVAEACAAIKAGAPLRGLPFCPAFQRDPQVRPEQKEAA